MLLGKSWVRALGLGASRTRWRVRTRTDFHYFRASPQRHEQLFRKPISEGTVAANLRKWKTGGLRKLADSKPFPEVIFSGKTPKAEERIADHPCLKPQHFMRVIVRALLPLGEGVLVDLFMGSGATIAAADRVGYDAIGIEVDKKYFEMAVQSVPRLAALYPSFTGQVLEPRSQRRLLPQPMTSHSYFH